MVCYMSSTRRQPNHNHGIKQDYAKLVLEEKKREEWFQDRYLPQRRLQQEVEAKRAWAAEEAGRFKVRFCVGGLGRLVGGGWIGNLIKPPSTPTTPTNP